MFSKSCEIIASLICWFGVFFAIHSTMLVLGFHCDFFFKIVFLHFGRNLALRQNAKTSKISLLRVEKPHPTLPAGTFACSSFPLPPSPPPFPPPGWGGVFFVFPQKEGLDKEALGSTGASDKLRAAWGSSGDLWKLRRLV